MHIETSRPVHTIDRNRIITIDYNTYVDDATNKKYIRLTTHEVTLYASNGRDYTWTNQHQINEYV